MKKKFLNSIIFTLFTTLINQCGQFDHTSTTKPITIWVHGTLFPLTIIPFMDKIIHTYDIKYGLNVASNHHYPLFHGKIPHYLHKMASKEFPIDCFHFFGWSGKLSFRARREAAEALYEYLKKLTGPITLIGHSHGGTIILELARIAQERNDNSVVIDRVILLAMPVQVATSALAHNSLFKEIFVLYSEGDLIQVLDPQRIYPQTPKVPRSPFFSERSLPVAPHIKQAKILINQHYPYHLSFALSPFIKNLPGIIELMRSSDRAHGTINIGKNSAPQWIE